MEQFVFRLCIIVNCCASYALLLPFLLLDLLKCALLNCKVANLEADEIHAHQGASSTQRHQRVNRETTLN